MGNQKTIIISTHLLDEAEYVCNRIILINHGKIIADGTVDDIINLAKVENLEKAFYKLTTIQDEA